VWSCGIDSTKKAKNQTGYQPRTTHIFFDRPDDSRKQEAGWAERYCAKFQLSKEQVETRDRRITIIMWLKNAFKPLWHLRIFASLRIYVQRFHRILASNFDSIWRSGDKSLIRADLASWERAKAGMWVRLTQSADPQVRMKECHFEWKALQKRGLWSNTHSKVVIFS